MTKTLHSLLDDPLISVRTADGEPRVMSLPQIYEALITDEIGGFDALQPHQKQPWFTFLVQVAAMAIDRSGRTEAPADADMWRDLLVGLSEGSESAWCLVVDDASKPAFLQPPIPEGSIENAGFKADRPTPDALDMLLTKKSHAIKRLRIHHSRPEHWIFALLTLQTFEGYMGVGNYGIARMNGGLGNRPLVAVSSSLDWTTRFRRDLSVLINDREVITEANEFDPTGLALVWLEPWDGSASSAISLFDCDPYFIEICRRLRFTTDDSGENLICWRGISDDKRITAPDSLNGRTGDPWTPIDLEEDKVLTLGGDGFTYEKLQELWFDNNKYQPPPALEFQRTDSGHVYLIAKTLVRGMGETEGLHHRVIRVPKDVQKLWTQSASRRKQLAERSARRVQLAGKVQKEVLQTPIVLLVYAGEHPGKDTDWDKITPWIEKFDRRIDARFFDDLWSSVEKQLSDNEAEVQWQKILRELAEEQYKEIRDSIPLPSIHRYRVLSQADGQFHGRLRSVLHRAFEDDDSITDNEEETDDHHALAR